MNREYDLKRENRVLDNIQEMVWTEHEKLKEFFFNADTMRLWFFAQMVAYKGMKCVPFWKRKRFTKEVQNWLIDILNSDRIERYFALKK